MNFVLFQYIGIYYDNKCSKYIIFVKLGQLIVRTKNCTNTLIAEKHWLTY